MLLYTELLYRWVRLPIPRPLSGRPCRHNSAKPGIYTDARTHSRFREDLPEYNTSCKGISPY